MRDRNNYIGREHMIQHYEERLSRNGKKRKIVNYSDIDKYITIERMRVLQ